MDIHTAVERGNLSAVEAMIGADPGLVRATSDSADQPLHIAAWQRRAKIAEFLLDSGADVNAKGERGRTPLHYAVENVAKSVVRILIAHGADASIINDDGLTPLYRAAATEDKSMTELLLKQGVAKDIMSAAYIDGPESVVELLQNDLRLIKNMKRPQRFLFDAIRLHSLDLARLLLDNGVDPNANVAGLHLLQHAISDRVLSIIKLLLERGANTDVKDNIGTPLLKFAEICGLEPEGIKILQEYGARE